MKLVIDATNPNVTIVQRVAATMMQGMSAYGSFAAGIEQWTEVCTAPCGEVVDPKGAYKVIGVGVVPTETFRLPHSEQEVRLKVDAGSPGIRTLGYSLDVVGGVSMALGGSFLLSNALISSTESSEAASEHSGLRDAGLYMLIGGGVALVGGIVLNMSAGSKVTTSSGQTVARRSPSPRLVANGVVF